MMLRALAACCLTGVVAAADFPEDAALRGLHFISESEGWAVGDQGAIYRTMDKGVHWDRQPSGTAAMLTGIRMLNTHEGLAVGAQGRLYDRGSGGVVLGTGSGGAPWLPVSMGGRLPGLRGLALADGAAGQGWAWGDPSDQNPGGLFATSDFGKSWSALRAVRYPGWKAGALFDGANGFVAGADRSLAAIRGGTVKPLETAWQPGSAIRAMTRAGGRVWAVGDRAQAMRSEDAGVTWTNAALAVPAAAANVVDHHAVAAVGDHVWIAGRPGSVVFHSADAGKTWERQPTGGTAPIYALSFPTETHGYAVGAYGTRLRTEDGGKTWARAEGVAAAPRAAALFVVADGRDLPMATLARYGLDQGYHCTVLAMCAPDLAAEPIAAALRPERLAEGVRLAGGALGETLPLFALAPDRLDEPAAGARAAWNRKLEGKAFDEMVRALTLAIRMHQPNVVVTPPPQAEGPNETPRGMIGRAVYAAIGAARNAEQAPELADLKLEPHVINKVYVLGAGNGKTPPIKHVGEEIAERLGQTYAYAAGPGTAAFLDERAEPEQDAMFALVASGKPEAETGKSLFAGLDLRPGDGARRTLRAGVELTDAARKQLESRQNLIALADRGDAVLPPAQAIAGLQLVARSMKPADAARTIHRFARRFAERGRWELAQDASEFLVASFPEQPSAVDACQWLMAYYASGEARLRVGGAAEAEALRGFGGDGQAPAEQRWCKRVLAASEALQQACPELAGDARVRLLQASALRRLKHANAKLQIDSLGALDRRAGWQDVVIQERFALSGEPTAALPAMVTAAVVRSRPKLDGALDDDIWQGAAVKLAAPADGPAGFATEVRFRHDGQYLYLAARCQYPDPARKLAPIPRDASNRDANLAKADRLEIMLDIDRDYATWWRLAVDQQGRVADDCWGDRSWNPKWHVATADDGQEWRLEAAVPLAELLPPDQSRDAPLALGVQRVVPGLAVHALRQPASATPRPENFQLLRLDQRGESMLGQ